MRRALSTLALALALGGCTAERTAPPAAPRPSADPAAAPSETVDALATGPIGVFRNKRFDLALPLPDGRGFTIDDTRQAWLSARHAASSSTLLVRRWHAGAPASRASCEAAARRGRTLPTADGAEVLEVRSLPVPAGHDTEATVALFRPPPRPGEAARLFGLVLAFGSSIRQCFAFAFVTEHAGDGAEEIVAARLARVVDQSLAGLDAQSDLDPPTARDARPATAP